MLSIAALKSSNSASQYYEAADYYAKGEDNQSISYWQGKGATVLSLNGSVDSQKFKELLDGKVAGQQLGKRGMDGSIEHKCGWDLTFSAPKSVSVLALVGNDKRLIEAVQKASNKTIKYIEQNYAITRQMKDGKLISINEKNIVCAAFVHTTSRELDPQLHIHNVLMNMLQREDGNWRSIESKSIYDNSMLLGQMFRSDLAKLVVDLGYEIKSDAKTGFFEIVGVPNEVNKAYSKRRAQIEDLAKESKISGAKTMDKLNLITRKAKREVSASELIKIWDKDAEDLGFDPQAIINSAIYKVNNKISNNDLALKAEQVVDICAKSLFEMEAVISRDNLLMKSLAMSLGVLTRGDLEKAINSAITSEKFCISRIPLHDNTDNLTLRQSYRVEDYTLKLMQQGQGTKAPVVKQRMIYYYLKDSGFKEGQVSAVKHIVCARDQIIGVQGYAGTGKTHMLKAATEILQNNGVTVKALGTYNSTTSQLEKELNIPCYHYYL